MSISLGELAAAEILSLKRRSDGRIVPDECLRWAADRKDTSALGRYLMWDNEVAGDNWRRFQIRQLIGVYIRDENGDRQTISLVVDRKYGGGYRVVEEAFDNKYMREAALSEALAELERCRGKYSYLLELAAVFDALDQVGRPQKRKTA